ncbi:secretin N-terminal domain-containing protein [Deinococcus yavapaiensis]|uniref:Type II/III secretion system protein n=1 Tax=Deinococcus yavapaiensis KR-236 TaxID=694435 RepID=A0A318SBG1_9DEIO|nr:secretin N-terminal domain-containing protein [Deinococcus yavapaiensis]PYE56388.1 type II/III secretion system protein [Deinococcus yavapaiensis KR-236]
MIKRALTLMMTAALGMASAQTLTDARLVNANVSLEVGQRAMPLSVTLSALARSAGYDIVFDVNVDALPSASGPTAPTMFSFQNKPFNEVWPLLMDVYGLNYRIVQVGGKDVLRVSNTPLQRVVDLKNAAAADVEARLKSLLPNVRVVSDIRTNSLIVSGSNRDLTDLDGLLTDLDRPVAQAPVTPAPTPPAPDPVVQNTVTLQNAQAAEVEARLKALFPNLRIVSDVRTNTVFVSATAKEFVDVSTVVSQLDRPIAQAPVTPAPTPPAPDPVVQNTVTLQNAQAAEVEARLKALFPNLRIVSDVRTNTVFVSATAKEFVDVSTVVSQLDRAAQQAATQTPDPSVQRVYTVQSSSDDIAAFLRTTYPTLVVTPVGKTNQLVVSGPTSVVNTAFALLGQVDRPLPVAAVGPAVVQRIFTLANAQASEIKAVLENTLATRLDDAATGSSTGAANNSANNSANNQAPTTQSAQDAASAAASQSGSDVTIIADQRTNTLIVRGTPEQVAQVAELIPVLDVRVPQINVQIRIQEITEDAARTLGIDWSAGIGNFVTKLVSGNLTALFDNTTNFAGLNLGATLKALENQQLSKSIYDGNVTLQSGQRRQGNATSAENASAGASASIKSGGRVEVNIPGAAGNIVRQIDYGVLLDFLNPQVSNDGTITIGVRSSISNPQTALTGGSIPNILSFLNREASTTVSFKSGQTVLLGGLLTDTENTTTNGVPFLSSIPLVGSLFKSEDTRKSKAQLLIVLTGNIVQ